MEHDPSFSTDDADLSADTETADNILRRIRVKNVNKIIFGTLNINSLAPKFEQLKSPSHLSFYLGFGTITPK